MVHGQANSSDLPSQWVTLRTFDTPPLAELAKIHLAEAGIECRLVNTEIVGMNLLMGNAFGYIPLLVQDADLEAADQVLAKMSLPSDGIDSGSCRSCGEPIENDGPCPMCGFLIDDRENAATGSVADEDDDDDPPEEIISLDGFRDWGRPVIMSFLVAVLVSLAAYFIEFLRLGLSYLLPGF